MDDTPPEIRQNIYRKAVVELHNKIGVDYVAWMEDTASQVFDQYSTLDTTTFPETFGPRDDNPLVRFTELLSDLSLRGHDPGDYFESAQQADEGKSLMKDGRREAVMRRHKEDRIRGPDQKMLYAPVDGLFLEYQRPSEVLLTAKAIKSTPDLERGRDRLPKRYSDLGQNGKSKFLSQLNNSLPKDRKVEQTLALGLRPDFTLDEVAAASELVRTLNIKMKECVEVVNGGRTESLIYDRWEEVSRTQIESLPRPLSPPLLPARHDAMSDKCPSGFSDLKDIVVQTNRSGLILQTARRQEDSAAIGRRWGAVDDVGEGFVEEAMASRNLDDFDGVPFLPMTPASLAKTSALSSVRLRDQPPSPPATAERETTTPWEVDPRIESPLMPAAMGSPSYRRADINALLTPLPNPSPPLPPQLPPDGSEIGTAGFSTGSDNVIIPAPASRLFNNILAPGSVRKEYTVESDGYCEAEKALMAYAGEEQLDLSGSNTMIVPKMKDEPYQDPANGAPKSYPELAQGPSDNCAGHDQMMFIKFPGVNTALASQLDWTPYSVPRDSSAYDIAANVPPLPASYPGSALHPTDKLPSPLQHPSHSSLRDIAQKSLEQTSPTKPRWMTIQDAEASSTVAGDEGALASQPELMDVLVTPLKNPQGPGLGTAVSVVKETQNPVVADEVDELYDETGGAPPTAPTSAAPVPASANPPGARHQKRRKVKATSKARQAPEPTLDEIVLAMQGQGAGGTRKGKGKGKDKAASDEGNRPEDISSLAGFLRLQNRPDLASKISDAAAHPIRPDVLSPIEEEEETDWRSDPVIQNPTWYLTFAANPPPDTTYPTPVIATVDLIQNRPLVRALESRSLVLVDYPSPLQGSDLVLSSSTAVVFRSLALLPDIHVELLGELKHAATYYRRVVLVFEAISYAAAERDQDVARVVNPLTTAAVHALGSLRRGLKAAWQGNPDIVGKVELVFAWKGAGEVVDALRGLLEEDRQELEVMGLEEYELCEGREWMQYDPSPADEQLLIERFGVNTFCAWYALTRYGNVQHVIYDMSDSDRVECFGPIWGVSVVNRFNDILGESFEA